MRKALFTFFTVLALAACGDSSTENPVVETPEQTPAEDMSLETTQVVLQVNLPADANTLDTEAFSPDDLLSYHASLSTDICMPNGETSSLDAYFLKTAAEEWDVYFTLDDDVLNVASGDIGGSGFTKASLQFSAEGDFYRQFPYVIQTAEITTPEKDFAVEIDFYSKPTTTLSQPFNVQSADANGC